MWGYVVGFAIRWGLFFLNAHEFLSSHAELTTPIVSLQRLKECQFLNKLGMSPYDGGICHVPPILLWALSPVADMPLWVYFLVITAVDLAVALAIREFARKFQASTDCAKDLSPGVIGLAYFMNPFTIAGCLALSLQNVQILVLSLAMVCAAHGRGGMAAALGGATIYLSPGPPVIVLFSLAFLSYSMCTTRLSAPIYCLLFIVGACISFLTLFASPILDVSLAEQWDACFAAILQVRNLHPGLSVFWYVFIQVFPRFRTFFQFVYQGHVIFYIVPIHLYMGAKGRMGPFAQVIACAALQSLFKPYPTVIDFTYALALLLICVEFIKVHQRRFIITLCTAIFCLCMLPTMNTLWLIRNTGNANHFYWLQIVYFGAVEILLNDWTTGGMKHLKAAEEAKEAGESKKDK